MPLGTFVIGGVTYRAAHNAPGRGQHPGYSGYKYPDTAKVTPLLGRDPLLPDKNEVIQTGGLGAKVAEILCHADTISERNALEALQWTRVTHDDGTGDPVRTVFVVQVDAYLWKFNGSHPAWMVKLFLREVT